MRSMLVVSLSLLLISGTSATAVTPVQKVIQLMEGMIEKGKKEKEAEVVQFATYKQFCDDTAAQKKSAIEDANEMITVLKADVTKYTAEADRLALKIGKLDEDIATMTGDLKAARTVRDIDEADYIATHKDLTESVDSLRRAAKEMKSGNKDRTAASLAQLSTNDRIPKATKRTINAFLAEREDPSDELNMPVPEAKAYESHSDGLIAEVERLLQKFIDQRTTAEKKEIESKQAFEMLSQDLTMQIEDATEDRDESAKAKAVALQDKANAEGDLADTTGTRDADTKYLTDLVATCEEKAGAFESRQKLRAEEIEAVEKAIEIISSGAVSGAADKHLPSLLQTGSSLAQLRAAAQSPSQAHAAEFLQQRAQKIGSRVLSAIALRVGDDPFAKVKKMVKDLIVKLMEEANEEATHKGWCDTELSTNLQTREQKTMAVQTLTAQIDELEASIAKLTEDITELTDSVAELDAAMSKATNLRYAEKAKNEETIEDSKAAQTAVAQALTVLKEFYAKAAEATAFVQQPEVFDEPYQGMGGDSGGVVGMLEVIESDFARLEADTSAAEATAQKEYETFMNDSNVDKMKKTTDIEHKSGKKAEQTQTLSVTKDDLEGTQKELDSALAYYDKLKPSCVDSGNESFEDKVKRRKEEIESLQEALQILQGEDLR
eukprot:gnl/TRDRNA2_/TRDRNA2_177511_c1_seq1.p1 gnl/TRDRNA2_/TRDRNA2_177511_c1~~gnl/TRDRNA2_/TRDRNA2_177511_c1_seq1.p1  ORF type:complete len:663 (+),score=224.31 gnl/TRDRNA2_/TRDRNA2_177511_c1_seq1:126-2114(+)